MTDDKAKPEPLSKNMDTLGTDGGAKETPELGEVATTVTSLRSRLKASCEHRANARCLSRADET